MQLMTEISRQKWLLLMLVMFGLTVLSPQGVGVRLPHPLPNLDLQRIFALGAIAVSLCYVVVHHEKVAQSFLRDAYPKNVYVLIFASLAVELYSCLSSGIPYTFIWLAGDAIQIFVLALAVLVVFQAEKANIELLVYSFALIGLLLSGWLLAEVVFGVHLIQERNLWTSETVKWLHSLKRFTVLPMGPYAYVQSFVYAVCLFFGGSGFLPGKWSLMLLIFILALLFSQMISAVFLCMLMVAYFILNGKFKNSLVVAFVLFSFFVGLFVLFPGSNDYYSVLHHLWYAFDGGRGSIEFRVNNLGYLYTRVVESANILSGFGIGALRDPGRVVAEIYLPGYQYRTDPGSFFIWFVEGGLLMWLCIMGFVANTIYFSCKALSQAERYICGGLFAFFIISLSSQSPYLWGQALVFCGLLEYSVKTRSIIH